MKDHRRHETYEQCQADELAIREEVEAVRREKGREAASRTAYRLREAYYLGRRTVADE